MIATPASTDSITATETAATTAIPAELSQPTASRAEELAALTASHAKLVTVLEQESSRCCPDGKRWNGYYNNCDDN
jgi:hypothetical protein